MITLINLTPHAVVIHGGTEIVTLPPSGKVARRAVKRVQLASELPVPVFATEMGEVVDLPAPVDGVLLIVSALVADSVRRADVMSPGELVRDDKGNVVGCKGLTTYTA
jgi:hypothetical protein